MVTKRNIYEPLERVESAISALRAFEHPALNQIISRDLNEAKAKLEYAMEIAD